MIRSSKTDELTGRPQLGQPTWRIAYFYPLQGGWSERDYLRLDGGPLVEFEDGVVEVLEMPSKEHQRIAQFLFRYIQDFVTAHGLGEVFVAPLPVMLWERKFREPDIVFLRPNRAEYLGYPVGADLVVEVVSPDPESRRRDMDVKPAEYAKAKIGEYWVVDPAQFEVHVHTLEADRYAVAGVYGLSQHAISLELDGLAVSVDEIFGRPAQDGTF